MAQRSVVGNSQRIIAGILADKLLVPSMNRTLKRVLLFLILLLTLASGYLGYTLIR